MVASDMISIFQQIFTFQTPSHGSFKWYTIIISISCQCALLIWLNLIMWFRMIFHYCSATGKKKGRENWKWFFPVYINFTLDGFIHHDDSICEIWVGIHLFRSHTLSCYNYMADNATNKQSDPIISSMHNKVTRKLKSIKICEAWKKKPKMP